MTNARLAFGLAIAMSACSGHGADSPADLPADPPTGPIAVGHDPMTLAEAEHYALELINRDRAAHKLSPVKWDETAAKAGRGHVRDMAANGFTAHVGSEGDVPEQRYTEAGGSDLAMENVGCLADGVKRPLVQNPKIHAKAVEAVEQAFMAEVPPNDGHKKNILAKWHTSVGVGLAVAVGAEDVACMAQEFVDDYGDYDAVPKKLSVGAKLHVAGTVKKPLEAAGVGLARIDFGRRYKPDELNETHGYAVPDPYVTYFGKGYKTLIEVQIDASRGTFSVDVPVDDKHRPGLYEVSVWAKFPGTKDLSIVSLRTIEVN